MEFLEANLVEGIIAVLVGFLVRYVAPRLVEYLKNVRDTNDNEIISIVTGEMAELVEAEFIASNGSEKFEQAILKTKNSLANQYKMFDVDDELIRAGVQRGYNQMKKDGNEIKKDQAA